MKILFQGDSITDCHRDRSNPMNLSGYTSMVAELLGENEYYNLGISGHRSTELLARYEEDISVVKPDIYVLLIGINDVWRGFDSNKYTPPEKFAENIRTLLSRVKQDVSGVKIIIMEPFLLPAPDKKHWRSDLIKIIDELRQIAVNYADGYIPLDGEFAKAWINGDWQEFSLDGVHPTDKGNELIAKLLYSEITRVLGG